MKDKKTKKAKKAKKFSLPERATLKALPPPDRAHDPTLLATARLHWQEGAWADLARIEEGALTHHPDRARLALIVASAHGQSGDARQARRFTQMALEWGCSKTMVAHVLISTAHNTLGRVATCLQDPSCQGHFTAALRMAEPGGDLTLLSRIRQIRETTRLGLLPEAAALMASDLTQIAQAPADHAERLAMLDSRLAELNDALAFIRVDFIAAGDGSNGPPQPDMPV